MRQTSAIGWIKIGILIGIGILLTKYLLPLGLIALVFLPPAIALFCVALFYTKIREWFVLRLAMYQRERRK